MSAIKNTYFDELNPSEVDQREEEQAMLSADPDYILFLEELEAQNEQLYSTE